MVQSAQATSAGNASKKALQKMLDSKTKFEESFAILNDAQKNAVQTIDGPLMVVAGPGTGKTQVIALRVGNILRSTQMKPRNVLCLTFSKSGATAMRKRLREYIGSDAYGVTIDTIHGFCNSVISSYPQVFAEWSSLTQLSDVERYRILNKIIDQLMPGLSLVSPKNPYARGRDILGRISQLKREGVTDREQLEQVCDEYDDVMANKSKEGTKVHARNIAQAKKFREFVDVFLRYQEELDRQGLYDYDDMILFVINALKNEDWLLASLQERYQYILVDEAQDLNGAQHEFLDLLTEDPTGDNAPNYCIVGDDDQAIYRFQGANVQNLLSFTRRFPEAPIVALTTSYRCSQPILDAADCLISQNTERLVGHIDELDKSLRSGKNTAAEQPKMLLAASDMSEQWMIAELVEDCIKQGTPSSDIAVLTQTNAELLPLYDVLKAKDIPVHMSGKLDLLSHPLVEQVIAILRCIDNPNESARFANALACECFHIHGADLAKLFALSRDNKCTLLESILDLEEINTHLRSFNEIMTARDLLLDLSQKRHMRTALQTVEHIYRDTGLLAPAKEGEMDVVDFAAGQEFFDRVKNRSLEQHNFRFEQLLSDLDFYLNPDYSDVRLTYDLPHLTQEGVALMTAHRSKGLEFDVVIIPNFREGHWDKRRNPPSLSVPEDLLFGWENDQKKYEKTQDERRVAFVAMTRARNELIFTCPNELTTGDSIKAVSPSSFFAEAGDLPEVQCEVKDPTAMSTLIDVPKRLLDEEFQTFLRRRIENFALSPTSLNHFLEDPQMFLEVDLLQHPQAKESHFAYGNAVHHVLAKWALSTQEGESLPKETLLQEFSAHLDSKEILTEKERERLVHLGHQSISRYFDVSLQPPFPIVHKVEFGITAHLGDIPLKGKLDRIDLLEPNSSAAIVTDFKTGKPKTPKQIEDYGYLRQLVFYSLLIEHGYSFISPKEFVLDFIGEGDHQGNKISYTVSAEQKKELTALIEAVWEKILALDFTPL